MENHKESKAAVDTMLTEYEKRKNWLIPALQKVEGFKCAMPEGAFYAFVDVRGLLGNKFKTSAEIADSFLRESYVVVSDGKGFGADGFLRFSYATTLENLQKALEKLKVCLNQNN
jgi:aspartate aminotransferase